MEHVPFLAIFQVKSYFVIMSGLHQIMFFKRTLLRFDHVRFIFFELNAIWGQDAGK